MAINSKQGGKSDTTSSPTILVLDEFLEFLQYHKSIKKPSSVTAFAGPDKTCLITPLQING